jgi:hypothetical protein
MKRLWVLPLAAILCGRPVNPPRLKPALAAPQEGCLANSRKHFLLAYAYRHESLARVRIFLAQASEELKQCEESRLRSRIDDLRNSTL